MKLLSAWPRQPFFGLAISAMVGILAADRWPQFSVTLAIVIAALAGVAWFSRRSLAVYALVALGFCFLHSARTTDAPGFRLVRSLGEDPRPVTVQGAVISEPKISQRGSASFLLQAESIEIDGETRPCRAKFLARWRQSVAFGDEVKLFGTAQKIEGPRNPGEFDLRTYLAREDVHRALIVRYPENGAVLNHGGGNRLLRAAQKSRSWMEATLRRGLENSPDVTSSINGMVLGLRHQTAEGHRRTVSANRHVAFVRGGGFARRDCGPASLDPGDRGASAAKVGDCADHSRAPVLRGDHGTAYLKRTRGGDERGPARRLHRGTKSVRL